MRFDAQAIMVSQRRAYEFLAKKEYTAPDNTTIKNPYYTPENSITEPAQLIQEQPFLAATGQYIFDFSSSAPKTTPTLGNVVLGKTQVFCAYGIQLLIGQGANANNRIYRSRGVTPNDDSIYNSNFSMLAEQSNVITDLAGQNFRDVATNANEYWTEAGLVLINPLRAINGELGILNITITLLNPIAALVLTPDLFLSVRLHGALGQAQGTN